MNSKASFMISLISHFELHQLIYSIYCLNHVGERNNTINIHKEL